MCDFTAILAEFGIAELALAGVVVAMGIAAAANASFFGAPAGVVGFALGAAAFIVAIIFVSTAADNVKDPACGVAACASQWQTAKDAMHNLEIAIFAATALCVAATVSSVIPVGGAALMVSAAVSVGVVGGFLITAARAISALQACITSQPPSTGATVVEVVAWVVGIALIASAWVITGVYGRGGGSLPKPNN